MSRYIAPIVGGIVGFFAAPFIGIGLAVGVLGGALLGAMAGDTLMAIISPGAFDTPSGMSGQATAQQNAGVTINNQGTNISIPVIYGRRKVGGTRVFVSSNGDKNSNLYIALTLCEGEIAGVEKLYLDDLLVWDATLTAHGTQYTVDSTKYKGLVTFEVFHGTANQSASTLLKEAGSWNDSCKLSGLAYVAMKLVYPKVTDQASQDANPWSGVPKITAQVKGRLIANAAGFANTVSRNTLYENESVAYNDNPVNCLLDYLRNPIYGKGLENDQINFGSFYNNAIKWDKDSQGNALVDSLKHKFNGVIFTDRTIMDNVKSILGGIRSSLPYTQGRYRLQVEDNGNTDSVYYTNSSSVMTINHDNILGSLNIESESTAKKYNRVIVTYMGGGEGTNTPTYEPIELTYPTPGSAEDILYLAQDNDRLNEYTTTLEHITSSTTAQKLAQIILLKSRTRGKVLGFTGDSSLAKLDVGDIITVQYGYGTFVYPNTDFSLTTPGGIVINGTFRVTNIAVNNDYTFSITAAEHDDNVYGGNPVRIPVPQGINRVAAGSGQIGDIYLPSSNTIAIPNFQFMESAYGVGGATASFRIAVADVYETDIYLKKPQDTSYVWIAKDTPQTQTYVDGIPFSLVFLSGLQYGATYNIYAQHRNSAGSRGPAFALQFTTVPVDNNVQVNPNNQVVVFT